MIIKKAELETVCGITSKLPENTLPEFAFAGKSNVGKSSLINALMMRKSLARTSSQPGKTQTINFYNINDEMCIRDRLSSSLVRNAGHRALQNLKKRLLDALAGDVAGDGDVLRLLRDLIDLVDIDNSVLRAADIIIRRLDDLQKNILHVLAHVARLGERGGVGDGKGDI